MHLPHADFLPKLTVTEIKALLLDHGIELPSKPQRKQYYVELALNTLYSLPRIHKPTLPVTPRATPSTFFGYHSSFGHKSSKTLHTTVSEDRVFRVNRTSRFPYLALQTRVASRSEAPSSSSSPAPPWQPFEKFVFSLLLFFIACFFTPKIYFLSKKMHRLLIQCKIIAKYALIITITSVAIYFLLINIFKILSKYSIVAYSFFKKVLKSHVYESLQQFGARVVLSVCTTTSFQASHSVSDSTVNTSQSNEQIPKEHVERFAPKFQWTLTSLANRLRSKPSTFVHNSSNSIQPSNIISSGLNNPVVSPYTCVHHNCSARFEEFELCERLGEGSQGVVYLVKDQHGIFFCAKHLLLKENSAEFIVSAKELNSPFIVQFHHCFVGKRDAYILMEYCKGGSLYDFLETNHVLLEDDLWCIFSQLVLGLRFLHSVKILHRDIKHANILLTSRERPFRVKLCDFGIAREIHASAARTAVGTPLFMAPEIFDNNPYHSAADIWALGVVLYYVIERHYPFNSSSDTRNAPLNVSPSPFAPLLYQMLNKDPSRRPTAETLSQHPKVASFQEQMFNQSTGNSPSLQIQPSDLKLEIDALRRSLSELAQENSKKDVVIADLRAQVEQFNRGYGRQSFGNYVRRQ
ncbi:hypothetical protein RCL1_006542 [Eukaryota sp. TZLM3-RCL]